MSSALIPLLLTVLCADLSLQDEVAPRTVLSPNPTPSTELIPEPTTFNLSKRADHIPPNFCGWFSGSGYEGRWTYNNPAITCFWNSDAKFVGNTMIPQTACIGAAEASTWSCTDYGCSSSVGFCTSSLQPYCVTFTYDSSYLSFVCSSNEGLEYDMEPFWEGFSDPIAFPVYTGSKGISTGTQYPRGYSTSDSSSSSSTDSNTQSYITAVSSGTPTSGPNDGKGKSDSAPVGAIVGGVVGGLAFIGLIVGAVIFFVLRRKEKGQAESQNPPAGYSPAPQPPYSHSPDPHSSMAFSSNSGDPQRPLSQQPPHYEIESQYNKPELDNSNQAYFQQAELPGMQPVQPGYNVSTAQQPFKAELASSGGMNNNAGMNFRPGGHHGSGGNVYEAP